MKFHISSPEQIGPLVRASRKAMQLRQDDAAGSIGVSENFLGKVERGSDSVQWGKLFQVMQELGLTLSVEVPEPFAEQVQARLNELHARSASAGSKAD
ncbi:helix-turn-helix domain-containing protein [Halopseudomonas pachastrellae]|jgi:transcriptional regulator with XRE-family HTH domain|nr:helix-turn-helix domain-containing protein [Halopseudomonas pachastrellae]MED5492126.1 transcriptional regulator [Pseudomonadota bacterium]WVM90512.1 helix-turn-helix domain-containing protein [Halopseudomonas pachastrellae]|tara:strand:- start:138 stop:431 length:294 start_codon:yes stop_codon:yes gene_type:complete